MDTLASMKTTKGLLALLMTLAFASSAQAFKADGFSNPFGVTVDSKTNYIYVSNVNGDPDKTDDNGFISRLKGDGTVDMVRYIDGASNKVTLNAPKGMAIAQDRLYVADIDKLHAFDLITGRFLFDVNFGKLPIQHFYDVTLGPDMSLYLADGPANTIYRINILRQHEVTTFISGEELGQPHGIAWFPARQVFAVAGWSSGRVIAFDRAGKRQAYPAILLRTLGGITADNSGNMFVTSEGLAAIYRINTGFALNTFKLAFKTPMGVAFSAAGNEVVAASFETGTVESISIAGEEAKAAAVADYIQPAPTPRPKPEEMTKAAEEEAKKRAEAEPEEEDEAGTEQPAEETEVKKESPSKEAESETKAEEQAEEEEEGE
jgi:DNA-binding beta-propeller fold protein YncE